MATNNQTPPSMPRPRHGPASWPAWRQAAFSLGFLLLVLIATLAALVHVRGPFFLVSCSLANLEPVELGQNSRVYSADGQVITTVPAELKRAPVSLSQVDKRLLEATVAIEDRRFYEHDGVDLRALLRALSKDVTSGEIVQGGSTITQQLVKNLYLGQERTVSRKLVEGCLAEKLEREWSKEKILVSYLNNIYYGTRSYGIQAAARTYFSKPAARLELHEAALLAGLPQAPSVHDPLRHPAAARDRRDAVLEAMHTAGYIDAAALKEARSQGLGLKPAPSGSVKEPELLNFILDELVARYGAKTVETGGLQIHTTIHWAWQQAAKEAIQAELGSKDDPATSLVAIDPDTGAIRVLASVAPGRPDLEFNLATQGRRQAGSSFKPFVLVEALKQGIDPAKTTYLSAPFTGPFDNPYKVETYSRSYSGRIPLTRATWESDNTAYVRLTLDLEPERVAETAHAMGIQSRLEPVDTLGLGVNSVSPLEMAAAYSTLAAGGVRARPFIVVRVEFPNGKEDKWRQVRKKRVLDEAVAAAATEVLEGVISSGTGRAADIGRPAAGKTGTTDDYGDAWFTGYTPDLAAAVWVGYPKARLPMRSVHGISVSGGTFPAQIWARFMQAVEHDRRDFAAVEGAVYERWCGRFQYARTYAAARPANGCPKPPATTAKPETTTAPTAPKTTAPTTTTAPLPPAPPVAPPTVPPTVPPTAPPTPPPAPPTPPAPPAPPVTPPTPPAEEQPADESLVGSRGRLTELTDDVEGQVEVDGVAYDARSESGEPLEPRTRVEIVAVEAGIAYVAPRGSSSDD